MLTLRVSTIPSEPTLRQKIAAVQLCVCEHLFSEEGLPALTAECASKDEIEEEFEKLIVAIQQKKQEAVAMLGNRRSSSAGERKKKGRTRRQSQRPQLSRRVLSNEVRYEDTEL
jgi:hypothetical protein